MSPTLLSQIDLEFLQGFLNYGAIGVLAIGFIVLLILFWRKDDRGAEMLQMLKDSSEGKAGNEELVRKMIEVIQENSEATIAMREHMERVSEAIRRLEDGMVGRATAERHEDTIRRLERDFGGRIVDLAQEIRKLQAKL